MVTKPVAFFFLHVIQRWLDAPWRIARSSFVLQNYLKITAAVTVGILLQLSSYLFSHTFKELNIARSPKILCLHIQRASVNVFGDLVKLQREGIPDYIGGQEDRRRTVEVRERQETRRGETEKADRDRWRWAGAGG
ncbi:hypothetical protein LguiA_026109 [Lonicera macranthoides]